VPDSPRTVLILAAASLLAGATGCLRIEKNSERPPGASDHDIQVDSMRAERDKAKSGDPGSVLMWASTVTAVHQNDLEDKYAGADWDALADEALGWLDRLENDAPSLGYAVEAMRAKAHLHAARLDHNVAVDQARVELEQIEDYDDAMRSLHTHAALEASIDHVDDVCSRAKAMARSDEEIFELIEVCRELSPGSPAIEAMTWVSEADRGAWERIRQFNASMDAYRRERTKWRQARARDRETMLDQYR